MSNMYGDFRKSEYGAALISEIKYARRPIIYTRAYDNVNEW